ncbi:hypothetical protein JHL17_35670 [Azospirillum sp. YIM B02556]|uniref:Response regulatory domain-containing protein n=1 Tax=Azospirillum endophyticum TaxID=2800326 RepID=A0ABS1FH38_9PROT|nr:hypothetical protein [Azospirillum endophyticum]MBK1842746.1 hypothetical protein [Azospirillum endophyticum]
MQLIDENATQAVRRAFTAGGLAAAVQELRRHVVIEDDRMALATVEALLASAQGGTTRL